MNLREKITRQEKAVIHDPQDYVYFEIIKGLSVEEMKEFDTYVPENLKHYNHTQAGWLIDEQHLVSQRQGHCTEMELIEDMQTNHNAERFRVYYTLKYPHMVYRREG